jgi:hypothetical protein
VLRSSAGVVGDIPSIRHSAGLGGILPIAQIGQAKRIGTPNCSLFVG